MTDLIPQYVALMKVNHRKADKRSKRNRAFKESGVDIDFCMHSMPYFTHPMMRLVSQFGKGIVTYKHEHATPAQILDHIREYEPDWHMTYPYQIRERHIQAFEWASKYFSPLINGYTYTKKDFIEAYNALTTHLRETEV